MAKIVKQILLLALICVSPALWAANSAPITVKITTADGRTIFVETAIAKYSKTLSDTMGDIDPDILQQQGIPIPSDFTTVNALLEILHTKGFAALHALEENDPNRFQHTPSFDAIVQRILADREYYATQKGYKTNFLANIILLANYLDIPVLLQAALTAGAHYWFSHEGLKNMDGNERAFHLPPELSDEIIKMAHRKNPEMHHIKEATKISIPFNNQAAQSLKLGPNGPILVTVDNAFHYHVWKFTWNGKPTLVKSFDVNTYAVDISPDGQTITSRPATPKNIGYIWNSNDGSQIAKIEFPSAEPLQLKKLSVSSDQKKAIAILKNLTSKKAIIRIISLPNLEIIKKIAIDTDPDDEFIKHGNIGTAIIAPRIIISADGHTAIVIKPATYDWATAKSQREMAIFNLIEPYNIRRKIFPHDIIAFPYIVTNTDASILAILYYNKDTKGNIVNTWNSIYRRDSNQFFHQPGYRIYGYEPKGIAISDNGQVIAIKDSNKITHIIETDLPLHFQKIKQFNDDWYQLAITPTGEIVTIQTEYTARDAGNRLIKCIMNIWKIMPQSLETFFQTNATIQQLQFLMAIHENLISLPITHEWFDQHAYCKKIVESLPGDIFDDFMGYIGQ